jgi:hypothetical protein
MQDRRNPSINRTFPLLGAIQRLILSTLIVGLMPAYAGPQPWKEKREIWFDQPSTEWKLGLPVGNGRLGAMVQGTFPKERIQLNEDSIWARSRCCAIRRPPKTGLPKSRNW